MSSKIQLINCLVILLTFLSCRTRSGIQNRLDSGFRRNDRVRTNMKLLINKHYGLNMLRSIHLKRRKSAAPRAWCEGTPGNGKAGPFPTRRRLPGLPVCLAAALLVGLLLGSAPKAQAATSTYNFVGVTNSNHGTDPYPIAIEHDSKVFPWTAAGDQNDSHYPSDAEYINISADNTSEWVTDDPGKGEEMAITFRFFIQEPISAITNIEITWNGNTAQTANHSIWLRKDGFDEFGGTNTWVQLGSSLSITGGVDTDLIRNLTSDFSTYINATTGQFEFVVTESVSDQTMRTNYVQVVVTYTQPLTSVGNTPSPNIVSENSTHTVAFTTADALPADGKIVVTFPAGFDLTAVGNADISSTTMDGSFSVSISGQELTITRSGGSSQSAAAENIIIADITNTDTAGASYTVDVETRNSGGTTINGPTTSSAFTITFRCPYAYKRSLVIDHTLVGADNTGTLPATGFPVLISLSGDWLKTTAADPVNGRIVSADGWDIIFMDSSGETLYHEIEEYDGTTGTLVAWVRIDSLSKAEDTTIIMCYGSPCVTSPTEDPANVWDAGFKSVWHLNDDLLDSTSNANHGTNVGTVDATGQIADGQDFELDDPDLIEVADPVLASNAVTLSAWVDHETLVNDVMDYIDLGNDISLRMDGTNSATDDQLDFSIKSGGVTYHIRENGILNTTGWQHVVGIWDGSDLKLFYNGAEITSPDQKQSPPGTLDALAGNFLISSNGEPFDGKMDELRISNTARNADWIKTEYNNQSDTTIGSGHFIKSLGSEQTEHVIDACLADHAAGQQGNNLLLGEGTITDAQLFGFKLTNATTGTVTVDQIVFTLSSVTGIAQGDFANLAIYVDDDNDGTIETGETTTVGGSGVVSAGVSTITFSTDFNISASATVNYILVGDVSNLVSGDTVTIDLAASNVTLSSDDVGDNGVTSVTHSYCGTDKFTYRRSITIDHTLVGIDNTGTLPSTGFPVLVSLSGNWLKTTAADPTNGRIQSADGWDIIFRASDGETHLYHEIEKYDGANGTLVAWVRVDSLSKSADTTIYMYYGNGCIDSPTEDPGNVWDANYKGVWHLKETDIDGGSGDIKDSTANANNGTTQGAMTTGDQVAGKIDGSFDFDGTNDAVNMGDKSTLNITNTLTMESWVNASVYNAQWNDVMDKGVYNWYTDGGKICPYFVTNSGTYDACPGTYTMVTGTWYHVAVTYNSGSITTYVNGAVDGTTSKGTTINSASGLNFQIGHGTTDAIYFQGKLDEIRVSNTVRDADWIKTEYNNQNSPATFYSVGTEESSPPTAVDLLSLKATGSGDDVKVTWETAQELDNLGFHLYRSTNKEGPYVRISETLIRGLTFSVRGRAYTYIDQNVTRGNLYHYKLEDIDTRGQSTLHGPVCVDWDGDGIPDDWEISRGLNPLVHDGALDYDGDGLSNLEEYERNTDPLNTDTDGDGIPDGEETWKVESVVGVSQTLGDGVEIVASDETGMTLELRTEAFEATVVEHEGETYERLRIPAYLHGWTQETGKPEMPVKGVIVDLPEGKTASLQVVAVEKSVEQGYWIYPVPEKVAVEEGGVARVQEVFVMDNEAYRQDALYPGVVAKLGDTFDYRGQVKQQVVFYPLGFNPAKGELEICSRIRVKVAYETASVAVEEESSTILYRGVSMSGTEGSSGGTAAGWSPPSGGEAYKIEVLEEGIYRLTRAWLEGRGVNVGAMNLGQVRMYNLGQELAIYVYDLNGNTLFDLEDYIEFYGQAVSPDYSKYAKHNVYWLATAGEGTPKRMGSVEGAPATLNVASTHEYTVHEEANEFYLSQARGEDGMERWYSSNFALGTGAGGGPAAFTVAVPGVGGSRKGQLTVAMLGLTELEHEVELKLNGAVLGTYKWSGFEPHDAVLGNVDLVEGNNTVTLTCLSGSDPLNPDGVAVDYMEVVYPRVFAAQGNSLRFRHEMGYRYHVTGFGVNSIEAFDVTEATEVKRIANGQVTGVGTYTLDMEPAAGTGERTYLAVTGSSVKTPVRVVKDTGSTLSSTTNGADWILITRRDLGWDGSGVPYAWLSNLTSLRQAQGLRVRVADVEDVCDEFSYGIPGPNGIKDFLSYAYANWTLPAPRYVLLVGDGTTDPRDNQMLLESAKYLPAYLAFTEHMGETAKDDWFVRVSGNDAVPDMDIGRLPAASVGEAEVMAGKIVSYESGANTQSWEKNVLLVADNVTADYERLFERMNNEAAANIPQGMNSPFREYLGEYGSAAALNTAIKNRINVDGTLVVNYSGHGSTQVWAHENIFDAGDMAALSNGAKLPFFVAMTCLNGYFVDPEVFAYPSLAEVLLRASGKGAVAVLASTGMTAPEGQHILDVALFEAVFRDDVRRLGPAITKAKQELLANGSEYEEVAGTFMLFGDPAMVLKVPMPTVPSGVGVSVQDGVVRVSWSQAQDCDGAAAAGYNLYRGTTPGGPYEKVNAEMITGTGYSDPGATSGTWYYVVSSVDGGGVESVKSAELSVTVGARSVGGSGGGGGGGGGCFIGAIAN